MARRLDVPAANPEIQPIEDEILRNWALEDIRAALPYRLSPLRRDTSIKRPENKAIGLEDSWSVFGTYPM
jgi:hypothetical protein